VTAYFSPSKFRSLACVAGLQLTYTSTLIMIRFFTTGEKYLVCDIEFTHAVKLKDMVLVKHEKHFKNS